MHPVVPRYPIMQQLHPSRMARNIYTMIWYKLGMHCDPEAVPEDREQALQRLTNTLAVCGDMLRTSILYVDVMSYFNVFDVQWTFPIKLLIVW